MVEHFSGVLRFKIEADEVLNEWEELKALVYAHFGDRIHDRGPSKDNPQRKGNPLTWSQVNIKLWDHDVTNILKVHLICINLQDYTSMIKWVILKDAMVMHFYWAHEMKLRVGYSNFAFDFCL